MNFPYNYHINDLPVEHNIVGDIAIDTEAMGLNYHRDRLCLLQIADSKQNIHLVHFKDHYRAENLKILLSQNTVKIFHFARFDLAMIEKYLNVNIQKVFCTKIASRLCRTYTHYHSLSALCQ